MCRAGEEDRPPRIIRESQAQLPGWCVPGTQSPPCWLLRICEAALPGSTGSSAARSAVSGRLQSLGKLPPGGFPASRPGLLRAQPAPGGRAPAVELPAPRVPQPGSGAAHTAAGGHARAGQSPTRKHTRIPPPPFLRLPHGFSVCFITFESPLDYDSGVKLPHLIQVLLLEANLISCAGCRTVNEKHVFF